MRIILSTHNKSKAEQIKASLAGLPVEVLTLDEIGESESAIEDGTTLEENVLKKAHFAGGRSNVWGLADDTGLFIDALGGAPGIHAARWAGDSLSTEDIMRFTLKKLEGVPLPERTATFRTVAALVSPEGEEHIFVGEVPGTLLEESRGTMQPNMPYSGLFCPEGYDKVWCEMEVEEENKISHRGRAFKQVRDFLEKLL